MTKFRVFMDGKMWYAADFKKAKQQFMVAMDGTIWRADGVAYDLVELHPIDDAIKMFWTGLKDKNGKEVWTGDIVSFWSAEMGELTQGEVEFADGRFYMWAPEECVYSIENVVDGEVVGNIHEHPHLLK